jgi:hypothetical protein
MKHLNLLFLSVCLTSILSAQGNLQFNQVLILSKNTLYTVPSGKVWKITSATYTQRGFYYGNANEEPTFELNGTSQYLTTFSHYFANGYFGDVFSTAFPMWLPASTTIRPKGAIETMYALEFNVVP